MKLHDLVDTPHGPGTVVVEEEFWEDKRWVSTGRLGVLHDEFPGYLPEDFYPSNILYYTQKELTPIEPEHYL
jgi:hypothetical protein